MDPTQILLWGQIIGEALQGIGTILGRLAEIQQRLNAGQDVTLEELKALQRQNAADVATWDAAAGHDRAPDGEAENDG